MTTAKGVGGRRIPVWSIQDRMRKAREDAQLDQLQLADRIGMSRQTIGNYETGLTPPKRPILLSWAMACDVDIEWLTGDYTPPARAARRPNNPWLSGEVHRGPWVTAVPQVTAA